MALTTELIKSQPALTGLTDEQISAITSLSQNDENAVIGDRIGKIYGDLDGDIKTTFGVDKNQGEKTYDYLKRAGQTLVSKLNGLKDVSKTLKTLEQEKAELEAKLKDGDTDGILKQKLADAEQKFLDMKTKYETDKQEWDTQLKNVSEREGKLKLDFEFNGAASGLQFKPEYDDDLKDILLQTAKQKILNSYKPDWTDNGNGGTQFVFRDAEGRVQNNPENGLNPYTAKDLMKKELQKYLADDKSGAGTKKPGGKGNPAGTPDVSQAKTQVEADEIITESLLQMGKAKGTREFNDSLKEMREAAGVDKLPLTN